MVLPRNPRSTISRRGGFLFVLSSRSFVFVSSFSEQVLFVLLLFQLVLSCSFVFSSHLISKSGLMSWKRERIQRDTFSFPRRLIFLHLFLSLLSILNQVSAPYFLDHKIKSFMNWKRIERLSDPTGTVYESRWYNLGRKENAGETGQARNMECNELMAYDLC